MGKSITDKIEGAVAGSEGDLNAKTARWLVGVHDDISALRDKSVAMPNEAAMALGAAMDAIRHAGRAILAHHLHIESGEARAVTPK